MTLMTAPAVAIVLTEVPAGWQRQMTLGPTPEFCLLADEPLQLGTWRTTTVARQALG